MNVGSYNYPLVIRSLDDTITMASIWFGLFFHPCMRMCLVPSPQEEFGRGLLMFSCDLILNLMFLIVLKLIIINIFKGLIDQFLFLELLLLKNFKVYSLLSISLYLICLPSVSFLLLNSKQRDKSQVVWESQTSC
jgi:hypothetical protein